MRLKWMDSDVTRVKRTASPSWQGALGARVPSRPWAPMRSDAGAQGRAVGGHSQVMCQRVVKLAVCGLRSYRLPQAGTVASLKGDFPPRRLPKQAGAGQVSQVMAPAQEPLDAEDKLPAHPKGKPRESNATPPGQHRKQRPSGQSVCL